VANEWSKTNGAERTGPEHDMVNQREQYVVDENGRKTGVILPLRKYRRLMEDLHDLAVVAERWRATLITLAQMRRHLSEEVRLERPAPSESRGDAPDREWSDGANRARAERRRNPREPRTGLRSA
jgi:PHD/YefM family antitoxin component YafN of YafNO toxin-antitoxin module